MLIVDINALLTVNLLDFLNDIGTNAGTAELIIVDAADAQDIVRAECAAGQLLTLIDMVAVLDEYACRVRNGVYLCFALFLAGDAYCKQRTLLGLLDGNRAGNLGKDSHFLGLARLEQLFNTRKTLGDIVACDTAGVECTHGKLSTGFADGLSRDNADGFACADGLADRKVDAVALCAHAGASLAGQDAADEHSLDAVRLKDLCVRRHKHMIGIKQHLAGLRIADGNCRESAVDAGAEGLDELALVVDGSCPYAVMRAAVGLADDNILADIDHSTGEVTGVGCTKCGIGKAFTSAS